MMKYEYGAYDDVVVFAFDGGGAQIGFVLDAGGDSREVWVTVESKHLVQIAHDIIRETTVGRGYFDA